MAGLPVNINDTYDDSNADASIALHQQHHDIIHAAVNNQVSKGELVLNLRDEPGVVGDGLADDSIALQSGLDSAAARGARAFAKGTFLTTQSLRITGSADLSDATVMFHGSGTAIEVGVPAAYLSRRIVRLPRLFAASKTRVGWGQIAGSVGVLVQNSVSLDLDVPHIQNFETGMIVAGYGRGTCYCNVTLGHLDNNKKNLRLSADASGWTNQNNFYGGRLSHNSGEGSSVPGARHISIDATASRINANSFWGTSIESPNVVEYHLDCAGNDNYFENCRWENTGSGARVIWRADSVGNIISHGYGSHRIVETKEARTANILNSRANTRMVGNGGGLPQSAVLSVENTSSSAGPAVRIMGAGAQGLDANQNTAWAMELSAHRLAGKRTSDGFERVAVDNVNGRLYVGDGTMAATKYFGALSGIMAFGGGSIGFVTDNTHDVGTSSHRPRYIRAGTGIQTGAFAQSARPSPSAAGIGTCIFDITLKKPIWSTGTAWVDATGKVV